MTGEVKDLDGSVRVFVTLGTDHHHFDRLLSWIEHWVQRPQAEGTFVLVQHGSSRAPTGVETRDFLPVEELSLVVALYDVIVTQGGPGGIMDARRVGRVPIAVPRLSALNEVVDDHQVAFCRRLDTLGQVRCVEDEMSLHSALDAAVRDPESLRCPPAGEVVDERTWQAFGAAVDRAVEHRRTGLRGRLPTLRKR